MQIWRYPPRTIRPLTRDHAVRDHGVAAEPLRWHQLDPGAVVDEELEQVWAGKKSAKEALDTAVKRGNELLERFQKANKG